MASHGASLLDHYHAVTISLRCPCETVAVTARGMYAIVEPQRCHSRIKLLKQYHDYIFTIMVQWHHMILSQNIIAIPLLYYAITRPLRSCGARWRGASVPCRCSILAIHLQPQHGRNANSLRLSCNGIALRMITESLPCEHKVTLQYVSLSCRYGVNTNSWLHSYDCVAMARHDRRPTFEWKTP